MGLENILMVRANKQCELCSSTSNLSVYSVPPVEEANSDKAIIVCDTCLSQLEANAELDHNHWRCLNDSMWSTVPAVQVTAWRMLDRLKSEPWAHDLLDMLYLDDETRAWAEAGAALSAQQNAPTLDSNGAELKAGDTVTLTKDLVVKGANFTAKRGTAVRNIGLTDNPEHIEGRVNGTRIVILTCFVKKS